MSFEKSLKKSTINNHKRNRKIRNSTATKKHQLISFILRNKIKTKKILEIGCSTGYILERLRIELKSKCYGIDISANAIKEGKKLFKKINLRHGFFENSNLPKKKFDLIICGFFLFLLPPEKILNLFSKIEKSLNFGGYLIIYDFYNKSYKKKIYKHDKSLNVYRWDFKKVFLSLPHYKKIDIYRKYHKPMNDYFEISLIKKFFL